MNKEMDGRSYMVLAIFLTFTFTPAHKMGVGNNLPAPIAGMAEGLRCRFQGLEPGLILMTLFFQVNLAGKAVCLMIKTEN